MNPPESRFCNGCGASLVEGEPAATPRPRDYTPRHLAEKILNQTAALEGERKHVTVLFADLADSTALAEAIGPDAMHSLMDRAFLLISEQIHHFEGTVNQFTGDGVMALFGAPLALEDAPRRAVDAAVAIQDRIAPLDAEVRQSHGRPFQLRIGIHNGQVVVGKIGDDLRMDYTAIGDTTNLAARLQNLAGPGEIVISDATRRLVEGYFEVRALEPTSVKGVTRPVHAFAVESTRGVTGRIDALSETGLTPYVGREAELEALEKAFDAARSGRGQVVFVVGEAGIGKSRMLYEFRRRVADVPHTWFEGRCASYARTTPFHALTDTLLRRFGIEDRDDEAAASEKLAAAESDQGGGLEWTLPFVRTLLSLPSGSEDVDALDAMTRRSETCRALYTRLTRQAKRQPVVFITEDLHWIDTASEEFLSFLSDSIPAASVLLVFTHRPGYQHPFGDRSYHVRIPLQALSDDSMVKMVGSVLDVPDLPAGLQHLIADKAEGNPLFIEEVVRSLLEEGAIRLDGGRLVLARDLSDISVPDRIQDVLAARLDRLPEGPKRAIQIASVIGREFALRLLQKITEAGSQLDGIVGELRALELIYEKTAHPELAYMFKHALTHDVAYDSVLVSRRRALHGIVGSAIEELYRDRVAEHYEALAHHFAEAEEWERAFLYHCLASEKSAGAYANHAASDHCRRALVIADELGDTVDDETRRELASRLASCSLSVSDFGASAEAFQTAADLAPGPADRALDLAQSAFAYLWNHDYDNARRAEDQAFAIAREHQAEAAEAFARMSRDERELVHGEKLSDESHIADVVECAERAGDVGVLVMCLGHLGQRAEWRGDYRRAIDLTERAVAIANRERIPGTAVFGQWFLGIACVASGQYGRGIGVLSDALEICDRIGDRAVKARLLNTVGWCYAEFGSHHRSADYNRMGTDLAREMVELGLVPGAPELYANAAVNLAGNLTALGRIDEAEGQLIAIQEQMESDQDEWMRWRYSLHLHDAFGRVALVRGQPEIAISHAEVQLAGARAKNTRKIESRALELHGRALLTMDRLDEAEQSLSEALAIARRIGHPPITWRSLALFGELERRRGRDRESRDHFENARRTVEERSRSVIQGELQREFAALGERLVSDPLGSLR